MHAGQTGITYASFRRACLCMGYMFQLSPIDHEKVVLVATQGKQSLIWPWAHIVMHYLESYAQKLPQEEVSLALDAICTACSVFYNDNKNSPAYLPTALRLWISVIDCSAMNKIIVDRPNIWQFVKDLVANGVERAERDSEGKDASTETVMSLLIRDPVALSVVSAQHILLDSKSQQNWRSKSLLRADNAIMLSLKTVRAMGFMEEFRDAFSYDMTIPIAMKMLGALTRLPFDRRERDHMLVWASLCLEHIMASLQSQHDRSCVLIALDSRLLDSITKLSPWLNLLWASGSENKYGSITRLIAKLITTLYRLLCYRDVLRKGAKTLKPTAKKNFGVSSGDITSAWDKMVDTVHEYTLLVSETPIRCDD